MDFTYINYFFYFIFYFFFEKMNLFFIFYLTVNWSPTATGTGISLFGHLKPMSWYLNKINSGSVGRYGSPTVKRGISSDDAFVSDDVIWVISMSHNYEI